MSQGSEGEGQSRKLLQSVPPQAALDASGTCCPPTAAPGVYLHRAQDRVGSPPPFPADWRCPPARHTLLSQRAEDKSGSGCLGNRAASTGLPLAGRPYEAAPSGSPGSPSGGGGGCPFLLRGRGDRKAASTAVNARANAACQQSTGKERGSDCRARREEGKAHQYWAAPRLESRELRGKGRSTPVAWLRGGRRWGSTGCCRMGSI